MKNILFSALVCALTLTQAFAAPSPAPLKKCTLPAGTLVILQTNESGASDAATVGKLINFTVQTDVMAEKEVVIRTGALAIGRVKAIQPATFNSAAQLTIELQHVQAVDGQMISLNGNEQTIQGAFPNQGAGFNPGAMITAQVMNTVEIKVN
jgi:hypothetical protein